MAESILTLLKQLEENLTYRNPKPISPEIFRHLLYTYSNPEENSEMLNKITYQLRILKMTDKALSLELLVARMSQFKYFPINNYENQSWTSQESVLRLLLLLADISGIKNKNDISEYSWSHLLLCKRTSNPNSNWKAPPDLFSRKSEKTSENWPLRPVDEYFLGSSFESTRASLCEKEYNLEEYSERLESIGSLDESVYDSGWFNYYEKDLMGAFWHVEEVRSSPFSLNLSIPQLERPNPVLDFPLPNFPLIEKVLPDKVPSSIEENIWDEITKELEINENEFRYKPEVVEKKHLWEQKEQRVEQEGFLIKSIEEIDARYVKYCDEYLNPPCLYLTELELTSVLKKILIGIPGKYVQEINGEFEIVEKFRLEGVSDRVTMEAIESILSAANVWKFMKRVITGIMSSCELITSSFGLGLDTFCTYYESFVINLPEISLLDLLIQTNGLRKNLHSVSMICQKEDFPHGYELIDYLYSVTYTNEGDFINSPLLTMIFSTTLKPFLSLLRDLVFYGEFEDPFNEFILKDDEIQQTVLLNEATEYLKNIRNSLKILKELENDLYSYYIVCCEGSLSTIYGESPPKFKFKSDSFSIEKHLNEFTLFQAKQTRSLMQLESEELLEREKENQIILEKKLARLKEHKSVLKVNIKLIEQEAEQKRLKEWQYFEDLKEQIEGNLELKRIEEENQIQNEREKEEKMKAEQEELIAKGKEYLLEQYENQLNQLYLKNARETWVIKRRELNEKRMAFYQFEEQELTIAFEKLTEIENEIEATVDETQVSIKDDFTETLVSEQQSEIEDQKPEIRPEEYTEEDGFKQENNTYFFPEKVKQPPGGYSTIYEVFQHPEEPLTPPPRVFQEDPRIALQAEIEKFKIASDLFYDLILFKVFRKITPKKKWNFPKQEPTRIFSDVISELDPSSHLNFPLPLVVSKLITDPIKKQSDFINKAMVHLFTRKLKLIKHLKTIKRYAMLEAGDTVDLFLTTLFSQGFLGSTTAAWDAAIKMSSSREDQYSDFFIVSDEKRPSMLENFRTVEDLEFLSIKYKAPKPLDLIINKEALANYTIIFVTLLRVRSITKILSDIKVFFHTPIIRRLTGPASYSFRRLQFLRERMEHFLDIFEGHIASEVHGIGWKELKFSIKKARFLDELIKAHSDYLNEVSVNCFSIGRGTIVMENLKIIFNLVMRFEVILIETDPLRGIEEEKVRELRAIEKDFNRIHRFLYTMTKTMAEKGVYPELFLRLDYNRYLARQLEKEMTSRIN